MPDTNKTLAFSAAVCDFHVYWNVWKPLDNEELECLFEIHNLFDMFAIKMSCLEGGQIVGHLPREISRPIKFLLDRGAKVTAQLTGTHYRRSYVDSTLSANAQGTVWCSERRSDYGKFFRTNITG